MKKILLIATSIFCLTYTTIAQAAEVIVDEPVQSTESLTAPVKETDVTIITKATNSKTQRILGGVSLEFYLQDSPTTPRLKQINLTDPPQPAGQQITGLKSGKYKVIAQRAGYEILEQNITISTGDKYAQLNLAMVPVTGLVDPDQQYQNIAQILLNNSNLTNIGGSSNTNLALLQALLANNSSTTSLGNLGNILGNTSTTGYSTNSNINATVPLAVAIQSSTNSSFTLQFAVTEINTGSTILNNTISINGYTTDATNLIRFGCVVPNSNYKITFASSNIASGAAQTYTFTSASLGETSQIIIPVTNNNLLTNNLLGYGTTVARNVSLQSVNYSGFTCPSNGITSNLLGQNIWQNQNLTDTQLRSYKVLFNSLDSKYYLTNPSNGLDTREIKFVQAIGADGGLAFLPAASGVSQASSTGGAWYVTTFSVSNGTPTLNLSKLSRVDISPTEYASAVNSTITSNFSK